MRRAIPASPTVRRGDIWWVDLDPTRGAEIRKRRPAAVLSADPLNRARRTVIVVPLSTSPSPRPPVTVTTPSAGPGSVAVCDQIRAVDKGRLTERAGRLSAPDLAALQLALSRILEIS